MVILTFTKRVILYSHPASNSPVFVLGCILTLLLISLPDCRPVLITAGDVQGHEPAAALGGPELAAAFEPTLELGA
jgi:hypothetical protein